MMVRLPLLAMLLAFSGPAFAHPRPAPAPLPHMPHMPLRPHGPLHPK